MKKSCLGLVLTLSSALVCAQDQDGTSQSDSYVFSRAKVYGHSAAFPAKSYLNLLVGPAPDNGNFAFARTQVEFGLGFGNWEISAIHRNDQNLRFHPDVAEFTYRRKNNVDIPFGEVYQADLWANQYQLSGAKLAYRWDINQDFSMKFAYSHLYATEVVSGYMGRNVDGTGGEVFYEARVVGGRTFRALQGDLYTDYFYTDDPFFEREVNEPSGLGFAVDVAFDWRVNDKWNVYGEINDLAGQVFWEDVGRTTAVATSSTFIEDENGNGIVNPNFEGVETYDDFTQDLTRLYVLGVSYTLQKWFMAYEIEKHPDIALNNLYVGYRWHPNWAFSFMIEPQTDGKALKLHMPVGDFHLLFDTLDLNTAKTLGFGWSFNFKF